MVVRHPGELPFKLLVASSHVTDKARNDFKTLPKVCLRQVKASGAPGVACEQKLGAESHKGRPTTAEAPMDTSAVDLFLNLANKVRAMPWGILNGSAD